MLGKYKLVLDSWCEIYDLLLPWADDTFWDFKSHTVISDAIYVLSQKEIANNKDKVHDLVEQNFIKLCFSNPAEGSETILVQARRLGLLQWIKEKKVLMIGGGDLPTDISCLQFDAFLPKIFDYDENVIQAQKFVDIFAKKNKPFKFLFLNGRLRPHRKFLIQKLQLENLLQYAIWSNLDQNASWSQEYQLWHNGVNIIKNDIPIRYLPRKYECSQFANNINQKTQNDFVKYELFDNLWGEIYLNAEPYVDTYFSLVTETVFNYPYSFRTEKTWKPMAMAHPWIIAANKGFYKDIKNLGFKTFSHLINENFDNIDNSQDRLNAISETVKDLCKSDLDSFLDAARDTCEYNQHHLKDMRTKVRQELPDRFFAYLEKNWNLYE